MQADIKKYGAVVLDNQKRMLITNSYKYDRWINLRGKPEGDETPELCLKREVKEEINVDIIGEPKFYLQSLIEPAVGQPDKTVQMDIYLVEVDGTPEPTSEIEKIYWLSREQFELGDFQLGSIMEGFIIPKLIEDGLM